MIGIYKITNKINNKVYIGQSINIEHRWTAHRNRPYNLNSNDYEKPLYRSIRKYGLDNFSFEVLEECNKQELNDREIFWINYYDSSNNQKGYNLTQGGYSGNYNKLEEKNIKEIQELLINSNMSQEEIGKKYNVSQRMISYINTGESWISSNLVYPLRVEKSSQKNKIEYFCSKCGKKITTNSLLCRDCYNIQNRKVIRPSREELKDLIRKQSFLELSRMYNVSDTAIRKWCVQYNLPKKKKDINLLTDEEWAKI